MDENVDNKRNVSQSVDPFGMGTLLLLGFTVLTKKKKSQAYCYFLLLNIAVEI